MLSQNEIITFWSEIMHDHTDFILMNLSSKEKDFINKTEYFKQQFASIGNNCLEDIKKLIIAFINFKCLILESLLGCDIELNLSPTFVNHMINEAMEFYNDIEKAEKSLSLDMVSENIALHKIWLADTSGHAKSIIAFLDPTEVLQIEEAKKFAKDFDALFIKTEELGKMLERTEFANGQLRYLNEQVITKVTQFIPFLCKIRELTLQCKLLGTIKPLIPDHMIREANYYLENIQLFNG